MKILNKIRKRGIIIKYKKISTKKGLKNRPLILGGRPGSNRRPSVPQTDALTS